MISAYVKVSLTVCSENSTAVDILCDDCDIVTHKTMARLGLMLSWGFRDSWLDICVDQCVSVYVYF